LTDNLPVFINSTLHRPISTDRVGGWWRHEYRARLPVLCIWSMCLSPAALTVTS